MQKKSFLGTLALCFFLGLFGGHRYYTGYTGLGIAQTLTLGGFGIWTLIDFIFICAGKYKDAKGQELEDYNKNIGVGLLVLMLVLSIIAMHGPKNSSKVVVESENIQKTVQFENATCTVFEYGYSCGGSLTDDDKLEIERIKAELKNKHLNE